MDMKFRYKLSIILTLLLSILLTACSPEATQAITEENGKISDSEREAIFLEETPDMGQEYIDSLIFIGESTTYHLKNRGVLSGGKDTKQVWAPRNGTINLDTTISTLRIVYPETGEEITIGEAVRRSQPQRLVLTFGLNGAVQKISKGEHFFCACYLSLIDSIRDNSPNTKIILQSCFPIACDMDMSNYSVDSKTLNSYIKTINSWAMKLADEQGLGYLNTAQVLTDDRGYLFDEYHVGDGHHLTADAYKVILEYIRTHAYTENI